MLPYVDNAVLAVDGRALHKRYGDKIAVNGIDFAVPRGSFTGLVGPNGAGKTTSLRMLTGLLRPDGGEAWVAGANVWDAPSDTKARIGVLPEDLRLFDRLTGAELLEYTGRLRSLDRDTIRERAEELLGIFGLAEASGKMVVDYSQGMKKKVGLAAALLHHPEVLFLDEPFEAIDPVSVRLIRSVLDRFVEGGNTIVFSSHVMDTVERLCDRVAIISGGELLANGPLDEIKNGRSLDDVFASLIGSIELEEGNLSWLRHSSP